jgi:hypothetical protein
MFLISNVDEKWRSTSKARQVILSALIASALSGCAAIDHFAPRTTQYNVETADSKSRAILANVVRASRGRPLQFTDITTISGTGSIEGSLGLSWPIHVKPSTVEQTTTLSPTVTANAGNTVNVANLNTQEFYYGLQTPLKIEQIANFISAGYDPQLVLFLTIGQVEVKTDDQHFVLRGTIARDPDGGTADYRAYYTALQFLLQAGLSTRAGDDKKFGPKLSASDLRDPRILSTLLTGAKGVSFTEDPEGTDGYRLTKDGGYKFCFDPMLATTSAFQSARWRTAGKVSNLRTLDSVRARLMAVKGFRARLAVKDATTAVEGAEFQISSANLCDPPKGAKPDEKNDFNMTPRSVEGIFQFLGDVVRLQMKGTPLSIGDGAGAIFPFRVVKGEPENAAFTVEMDGQIYSILDDPGGNDQSTRVVQLLTDLLALQSSAKDLPAPSVFSVISR